MKKKRCCKDVLNKNNLSFPKFVVGNLPLSMLLLKEEKQPCFNGKVEDPRQKPSGMTTNFNGFTLIELLVVVLIIGILSAVAVPQYQKAVEKARMVEAIMLVKTIANAHQVYYIATGRYLTSAEMELLDIEIPGSVVVSGGDKGRVRTKDFLYSPNGEEGGKLAVAQRVEARNNYATNEFYLYVSQNEPERVRCALVSNTAPITAIQRKLCQQISNNGTL